MALKGISWIEQNCEKLVVGVFGVGLLGVIAMQFVGVSSQVTLGTGKAMKKVPVEDALIQVGSQAKSINEIITNPDPVELSKFQTELSSADAGVLKTFTDKLGKVAPRPALVAAIDTPRMKFFIPGKGMGTDPKSAGAQSFMYAAVKAPAVSKPVGVSYLATIHPVEYTKEPEVLKVLPPSPLPKDKASVSVEATFDGVAFAEMLAKDPDGDQGPLSPLPAHWWTDPGTQVLAVELERQEQKPDGSWGDATKVKHMPGRVDLSPQIETVAADGAEALQLLIDEATTHASDVRHPKYYEIVFGEEWVTPSEAITILAADITPTPGGPVDDGLALKRELAPVDTDIANFKEQIAKLQGPDGKTPPPKSPGPGPGGGGKGGPGTSPGPGTGPKDPKAERIKTLQNSLEQKEKRREQIIAKWSKRGVELEADPRTPEQVDPMEPKQPEAAELPLLDNTAAKIIAHDVTVLRGKTYRYRISLVFNNPLYGKVVAANPDQEKLTKEPIIRGAASDWSDPITVDAETYYFITSASPQDALAHTSRASAELYIFRWGYWRKGGVSIEPGDILATDVKVPDFTKLLAMLIDPMGPNGQPLPGAVPPPGPGAGGKGRPVGPRPEIPDNNVPGVGKAEEAVKYDQVPVAHEAVMLEVAQTSVMSEQGGASKSKTENHVFLRDNDGTIVVRVPDGDKASGLYRKLDSSAKKGDEAVKVRNAVPAGPNASPVDPGRPKGPKVEPPPGGGGGGGGGGG